MNTKGESGTLLNGNEEHVMTTWRNFNPCYTIGKHYGLCSGVLWKVEFIRNEIGCRAEMTKLGSSWPSRVTCEEKEMR